MKVTNRITKFLNRNNPETIADEIAQVYHEKKDNGEEHPMDDTVELASKYGISCIIQPGGSIKDQDSIDMANKHNIAMLFTGYRHFKH